MGAEWAGGKRLPHPVELSRGLPLTEPGRRWAAMKGAMQFTDLI